MTGAVSQNWQALKEIVLFLGQPLAQEFGLGLYVAVGTGGWMFRSACGDWPTHRAARKPPGQLPGSGEGSACD